MNTDNLKPRDGADLEAAIGWAFSEGKALELVGHGTKRGIGRAAQWDMTLDMSGFSGVTLYEPAELVLSARAGTPLAEIEALVAANGQELAFEPMDYGPLLGRHAGAATIGGALAANLSGPRRIKAGAARDHFLGVTAVSGRGETFKSGGRVVKNVTGYDLCKLLAGSWGTLAAMTDVTVKVLPRAETEATLLVSGLDDARAVRAMTAAMGSSCDVSGAAHVPSGVAPIEDRAVDGVSPRRRRAVGDPPPSRARSFAEILWSARNPRGGAVARNSGGPSATSSRSWRPRGRPSGSCGAFRPRPRAAPRLAACWPSGQGPRCSMTGPAA